MDSYRVELVHELKAKVATENMSDRESFFQIYCEKLEQSEIIEDFHYLQFKGKGSRNRSIQIDGYVYNELDNKLTLFIIPSLAYYEDKTLTLNDADSLFKRAKYFYFDADKIISEAEESSEGYGLAYDILNKKIEINVLEIIVLTDYMKSNTINIIDRTLENNVRVNYSIYDISRMKLIDESENGKEPLVIDLWEDFQAEGIQVLPTSKTDDYQAYLCNIPGELLAKMYNKYQSRLLEGNVRSFLQTKGKVNKGIRNTILNSPEMFFAYNNGIAATAEAVDISERADGKVITGFKSLQIVNGGQTTASLANAWENDKSLNSHNQIKRIFVPMKISVVSQKSAEELIPNISRFANSQNKVSDADLASNHPFHRKVEELSRRIHAPAVGGNQFGKFWYYERANGQYRQETYKSTDSFKKNFESRYPKSQLFKKVDLAKYYNIFLQKPHIASAGAQMSFNKFSEWMIKQWDKNSDFVNDEFYRKVIALSILFKKADNIVRNQDWYDSYKANIVAYTLSVIIHRVETDFSESTIDFQQIWKDQDLTLGWTKQIQKVSYIMYQHLTREDRTVENVTEWAKRETSWTMAKEIDFEYEEEFIAQLINKKYVITQEYSAIKEQKKANEMNGLLQVYEYGSAFWKEVYNWGDQEKIWNIQDVSFMKLAMGIDEGKVPSDRQAAKILQLLEKARMESFPK
ncbi:MAG: AIPR family protein [Candidatus Pristimantibacillus lignocellulolyticus]|uniref:AIPR family protein n=1 Tax=Candidatus Pristimantibacillus lignocellulolyticus TaxID=2994561 RepID=A0A9J6Z9G2_9BACL|nr:MAG: AIPR family protein [Candidatus Pristimantibacillus lignocellulolyticus]